MPLSHNAIVSELSHYPIVSYCGSRLVDVVLGFGPGVPGSIPNSGKTLSLVSDPNAK